MQSYKRLNLLFIAIFLFFALAIGFFIGRYTQGIPIVELDAKFSLVNLLQIAVTIFIGVYVAKSIQNNKTEKELIIKRLETICSLIDSTQKELSSGKVSYNLAVAHLKRISLIANNSDTALSESGLGIDGKYLKEVIVSVKRLRNLYTKTDIKGTSKPSVTVIDNVIHIPDDVVASIDVEYEKLRLAVLKWQLAVNKK